MRQAGEVARVLALQASAGNSAVSQALSPGVAVQRKSLAQAGLTEHLNWHPEDKRALVGDGRLVQVYVGRNEVQGDRADALVRAAAMNGIIGTRIASIVDEHGWTPTKWALEVGKNPQLDPFHFWASVFYSAAPGAPQTGPESYEQLTVGYQHAASYTGYVEAIYDSSNPAAADYESMYDEGTERIGAPADGTGAAGRKPRYSNRHHTRERDQKVLGQTDRPGDQGLDAYTKIAGEGARWQCVRQNARDLSDNSRFFVFDTPAQKNAHGINFVTLWLSWKDVFNKRYNIPNTDVADKIRSRAFGDHTKSFIPMRGRDFLLVNDPTTS